MEEKGFSEESAEKEVGSEIEKGDSESSSSNLGVGRCIPGFLVPTVEALIINRKVRDDGSSDVTLLIAPYRKKGVWVKAATCVRNSSKLTKRTIQKYRYPLPWAKKLALEVTRSQPDSEWIRTTLEDINVCVQEAKDNKEVQVAGVSKDKRKNFGVRKSSSSLDSLISKDREERNITPRRRSGRFVELRNVNAETKDEQKGQRRKFRSQKRKKPTHKSIWGNSPRSRRAAARAIRSSSSDSQGSLGLGDCDSHEVGDSEEEEDGLVYCPFTSKDVRRYIDVKESIKGKTTERRFIRQALHNLYRHYTSLQTFVDSIRAKAIHNPSQPFSADLVWLEHHAIYIDCLLFESLTGMWGLWNEPILDLLVMSFLELTVRCTPRRQYPDKLEERVRKWMKKNQVGISSSYGPLPYFLQNAKLSERGVVINNQPSYYGRGRTNFGGRTDHRPRGPGGPMQGVRRGGAKPEGKGSQNE